MKKKVALLLATLMICLKCVANAETLFQDAFMIRNGIKAGMSLEEVTNIEIGNGNKQFKQDVSSLYGNEVKIAFETKLAGITSLVFYWFDDGDNLKDLQYWIMGDPSAYTSFENNLIEKYGQPFTTDTQIPFNTRINTLYDTTYNSHQNPKVQNYASWLLKYDDCCVVVELMKFTSTYSGDALNLNYCIVSHEEAEKVLVEINNEVNATQQSVMNDL